MVNIAKESESMEQPNHLLFNKMLFTANRKPPRDGRWLAIRVEKIRLRLKPSRSDPASCTRSLRSDALALCLPTIRVGNRARYLQDAVKLGRASCRARV